MITHSTRSWEDILHTARVRGFSRGYHVHCFSIYTISCPSYTINVQIDPLTYYTLLRLVEVGEMPARVFVENLVNEGVRVHMYDRCIPGWSRVDICYLVERLDIFEAGMIKNI